METSGWTCVDRIGCVDLKIPSAGTAGRGENRPYRVLIAVVTIYSVERQAHEGSAWSLARKPRLRSNISARDKAQDSILPFSCINAAPREARKGGQQDLRSLHPAWYRLSEETKRRTRDNFEYVERFLKRFFEKNSKAAAWWLTLY